MRLGYSEVIFILIKTNEALLKITVTHENAFEKSPKMAPKRCVEVKRHLNWRILVISSFCLILGLLWVSYVRSAAEAGSLLKIQTHTS